MFNIQSGLTGKGSNAPKAVSQYDLCTGMVAMIGEATMVTRVEATTSVLELEISGNRIIC